MLPDSIYQQMFEYNEAVQLLLDPETRCLVDVNPAAARFYGYPREEMQGMHMQVINELPDEGMAQLVEWHLQNERSLVPARHRLASGEFREVEIHISRVQVGQKTLLAGIVNDVTPQVRAEKALREANTWLNAILKNIPGGAVVLFDHNLRYLLADGAGLQEVGLNKALMEGKTIDEVFPPEIVAQIEEGYRLALQGRASIAEVAYAGRVYLVRYSPVYDENNRLIAGMAITADITERKGMENVLRESEMKYRSLILALDEGIVFQQADGQITLCNPSAERILGLTFDQLRGRTSVDPAWRAIHEDGSDFPGETHPAMVTLRTGQPQRNVIMGVHKPDGELRWISINSQPVQYSDHPLPDAMVASFTDITERRLTEQGLRASEARFHEIFDFNPDSIVVRSLVDERVVAVNDGFEQMYGYDRAEVLGQPISHFNTWIDPEIRQKSLQQALEMGKTEDVNVLCYRKDGSTFWGLIKAIRITIDEEPCLMSLTRDVTQYRLLALQQEKLAMLRQFLGNVSHDLKTPLTTIKSSLYVLKKSPDEEKKQHQMKVLELQTERMEHLLDEMFSLLRLDAGAEFDFEIADINALIRLVLAKHHALALAKHHQVAFVTESEIQPLRMDKSYLELALGKLLVNAHHYTPEAGHVTVRTFTQNHQVIIEIEDTGIGIMPSDLPHIFERFYRADWARSTASGGTGLGLTIAQKIVEAHGGQIRVESMVGEGTRFQIVLPLLSAS